MGGKSVGTLMLLSKVGGASCPVAKSAAHRRAFILSTLLYLHTY